MFDHLAKTPVTVQSQANTLFVSLELSKSRWLVTVSAPGSAKFSKYSVTGGDAAALLQLLQRLQGAVAQRLGAPVAIAVIAEAGLDGFWLHRLLCQHGLTSYIVDPASIAVPRRHRRAKTDKIDGEALLRTLIAHARGEQRVCAMVVPPSPEAEDQRRLSRERARLIKERIQHSNRIQGLLFGQGIRDYDPAHPERLARLDALVTSDGRALPAHLKSEIQRELARLELVLSQVAAVEAERNALMAQTAAADPNAPAAALTRLRGIGPEFASLLWLEALFRRFNNRRQIAAYAGLAPSPWQSGGIDREQGIAKSGNPRLRRAMVELAWFWLRHQPASELSRWFQARVGQARGRVRRIAIVALARKLLIALWRYASHGVVPEGAVLKA
jgi:transposase